MTNTAVKIPSKKPVSPTLIAHTAEDLFQTGKFKTWKKGQIANPSWLKREVSYDFVTVEAPKTLDNLAQYLACADPRLSVADYNTFSTGVDKAGNEMICLYDCGPEGDQRKVTIIICTVDDVAMRVVELVELHCGKD